MVGDDPLDVVTHRTDLREPAATELSPWSCTGRRVCLRTGWCAVKAGITKINIGTHLNVVFSAAARRSLSDEAVVDPAPTWEPRATHWRTS